MILKILHLNIERSKHIESVIKLLNEKSPDIICFEEAMYKDVQRISTELKYELAFAPRVIIKKDDDVDKEGSAILSKYPIKETQIFRYDGNDSTELVICDESKVISIDGKRPDDRFLLFSNLITISIECDEGKIVNIVTTHFPVVDHSTPGLKDHELDNMRDIFEIECADLYLDRLISLIRKINAPVIFTADLNNSRGEYIYDTISHELIDIVPPSVISTIDPVLHRRPDLLLLVDTIMISPDVSVESFEIMEGISDHKALISSLNI